MKISLNGQAELELVEGAAYYAREANAALANAFISEFDRSAKLLGDCQRLRAPYCPGGAGPHGEAGPQ